jgi:hypothetical protein
MLPDIAAENGLAALHEGVLAVERLHHDDLAIFDRKPAPAGVPNVRIDRVAGMVGFGRTTGCISAAQCRARPAWDRLHFLLRVSGFTLLMDDLSFTVSV